MKKHTIITSFAIVLALATLTACGSEPVADATPTPVDTTVVETTTVEPTVEEVIDEVTEPVEDTDTTDLEVEEPAEVTEEPSSEPSTEVVEEPIVEEPVVTEPTYTVTYFAEPKVMYCQEFSNFRVKPEQGAAVSYTKNTNATVTVVGTCTENGWYYIEDGAWTLASNLGDNEVVVATAPANSSPANHGYNIDPVLFPELIDFLNENANEKLDITYFTKDFYGNPIDPFYEVWRNDEDQFCFYPDGAITYVHWTGPGEGYGYAIAYPCR